MDLFKDIEVQQYLSAFGERGPVSIAINMFDCQCFKNPPNSNHCITVEPISTNLAELASNQESKNLRSVLIYITETSYLNRETMSFLMDKMLHCSESETVENYYCILDSNFLMHPPCAPYMRVEYENLMLSSYRRCFKKMTLWGFLVDTFNQITNGSLVYGKNKVSNLAFNRCLSFCVKILQVDFEFSKTNNSKPLIMKCLNYNPERATRLSEMTKLLDMLFNTGYDFNVTVIDLAHLINQMTK